MVTIILPPELEEVVSIQAAQQGTTPELFALAKLRGAVMPPPPQADAPGSMADFLADFIGSVNSSEAVSGASDLSKNTGRKFKELMAKKHRDGKL